MTMCAAVISAVAMQFAAGAAFGETLDTLVLNGTTYTATENSTIGVLTVTDGTTGNVITVPEGTTVTVNVYEGAGKFRKSGAGDLIIKDVCPTADLTVGAGKIFFARSAGVEAFASGAALHLDASKTECLTTGTSGTETIVSKLTDVRGAEGYPWLEAGTWGEKVRVRTGYQNGLTVMDFLPAAKDGYHGGYLSIANLQGDDATGSGYGQSPAVKGVWEVFLVVEDNPGVDADGNAICQSFLTDQNNNSHTYWLRGANGALCVASGNESAGFRNGQIWIDGEPVTTPTTTVYPSGMHLLRARRSAAGRFAAFGMERSKTFGGLKYGEVIAFKATVDNAIAERMSRCLMHKWLGKQTISALSVEAGAAVAVADGETVRAPCAGGGIIECRGTNRTLVLADGETCTLSASETFDAIRVEGGTAHLVLAANVVVSADQTEGAGVLSKEGAGTLKVAEVDATTQIDVQAGVLDLAKSAGVESLVSGAAVHLDASLSDSVTVAATIDATTQKISKWADARGVDNYAWAEYPTTWGRDCYPRYRLAGQNGLNYVDLWTSSGSWTSGGFFNMANFQGADAEGENEGYGDAQVGIKGVKEIFLVVKDQPNADGLYQSFLGDCNNAWNMFFMRGAAGEIWSSTVTQTAPMFNGTTWVDGQVVAASSTYPEGFHVLRARATAASQRFRTLGSLKGTQGGLAYGEIVVFKADVDDAAGAAIVRRLQHKWLGKQEMGSLSIGVNGKVTGCAGETVATDSLSLSRLDVTLGEEQMILPKVVTLADTGVVHVSIPADMKCRGGAEIPLLAATDSIANAAAFAAGWTIECSSEKVTMKPKVANNTLYGVVDRRGLFIVVE